MSWLGLWLATWAALPPESLEAVNATPPIWTHAAAQVWPVAGLAEQGVLPVSASVTPPDGRRAVEMLYLLDPASGQPTWNLPLPGALRSLTAGDGRLVAACDAAVLSIDIETGQVVWQQPVSGGLDRGEGSPAAWPGRRRDAPAALGGGLLLTSTGLYCRAGQQLYGLNPADGTPLWSAPLRQPLQLPLAAWGPALLVAAGDGLSAYHQGSGELVWSTALTAADCLAVGREAVYYGSKERLYALRADDGRIAWSANVEQTAGLAVLEASGGVIARRAEAIYVLAPDDGTVLWQTATAPEASAADDLRAYAVPAGSLQVHCFELATRQVAWRSPALSAAPKVLCAVGELVVAVLGNGCAAFGRADGQAYWVWSPPEGGGAVDDKSWWLAADGTMYLHGTQFVTGRRAFNGSAALLLRDDLTGVDWLGLGGGCLLAHDARTKLLRGYRIP